jgi:two-component system, OmpR family, sensor kinase
MNRLSLRTRLVAVAVALVAFAVTLVGVATYYSLRSYLYDQLDGQTTEAAQVVQRFVTTYQPGRPNPGPNFGRDPQAVVLADGNLIPVQFNADDRGLDLSVATSTEVVESPDVCTVRAEGGARYRAVALPVTQGAYAGSQVIVGLPTGDVDATLGRLIGLSLLIGAAAVIGTAVLGTVGVRLGMRPLDRVTRTARTVAAELGPDGRGLANRVPDADPNTEVGQLAEAVNTMLGAVEAEYTARYESEQRLRRFLADASHELRTPLTSLRGYAELVRMRGGLDPDAADSLRRIETEGKRMGGLVDDLLTLARSDRGEPGGAERAPVDVAGVVDDAAAGVRAAHPDRPVEVAVAGPLPVLGDRDQLLQVVTNVVANAAVHATAPAPIRLTAGREGGEVVVRVVDGGPGLPPEQAARVFERFWRADAARTRVRGGSGLGLSIVHALVADHGGRVSFDSTVDGGSTVTVRLPAAPAAGLGERPADAPDLVEHHR